MIEKIVLDYLSEKIPAYMEKEQNMPDEYALIEKTGSGRTNHVKNATIVVQSFSTSLAGAAKMNEKVKELMERIIVLDDMSKCELNTDYNHTNTAEKEYRYQAVFDIVHF